MADLPESARLTRFIVSRPARAMSLPVCVEPVNEIFAMPGLVEISSPTSMPRPSSTLTAPAGRPASCSASVTTCACSGPSSLGLTTDAQPAAMAEASLLQMLPAALFQGAMRPATPTGSIITVASPMRRSKA
ncbi:hypothetical protein FQZ97_1143130 [compost metagenome]